MSKERTLTENQKKFLDALFGEAKGDPKQAIKLAGYAESVKVSEVVKSLKAEILELAMNTLALNAPRAALSLVDIMLDPTQSGALNKIKVAQDILNRVGATTSPDQNVSVKVPKGGLFIMPAKDNDTQEKEGELNGQKEASEENNDV